MEDKLNKIDTIIFKSLKEIGDEFSSSIDKDKRFKGILSIPTVLPLGILN